MKGIVHKQVRKQFIFNSEKVFKVKVAYYGKLHIFSGKTLVLLHLQYLECVHLIQNGYSKQIRKIRSEKNLKFVGKVRFVLLEKSFLEFFHVFIGLHVSGNYIRTTVTFGKLPCQFHISHLYLIFNKSVSEQKDTVSAFLLQELMNLLV